jgi:hypothetical protein
MFSFFKKDPVELLNKEYYKKLESAMMAQRSGDIKSYSSITAEAEAIKLQIDKLLKSNE